MVKLNSEAPSIIENFSSSTYSLLEKIGEGGFGQVFKAKSANTGQLVAIKILTLNPDFDAAKRGRYIERFERETYLGSRLHHPNIVRLLDKGQCNEQLIYAVFEYVEGQTLKARLQSGPLPAVEAAEVMTQVLDALAHAHEQGVVHRDIKPANIMLTEVGAKTHVKVLDFGIGTMVNEARHLDFKTLTLTHEVIGTPSYCAPEQLRCEPPTPRTDLYVWGLVFVECLTGDPAICGSSAASIYSKQLGQAAVPLPSSLVGHPIGALLRRVLEKKVHERNVSADKLYDEVKLINFSNLVGDLGETSINPMPSHVDMDTECNFIADTVAGRIQTQSNLNERKQLSAMCIYLDMESTTDEVVDHEVVEALHRDQKNQCTDIATRYGAFHVGSLGDTLLFYFGFPLVSDNDSRLCARAALDIVSTFNKRNSLLASTQGIKTKIGIGIHTGLVTLYPDTTPEGDTPNISMKLSRLAGPGEILCSETSRNLLENYIVFEPNKVRKLGVNAKDILTYKLTGERQVEAFGFLRGSQQHNLFVGREAELAELQDMVRGGDTISLTATKAKLAHIHGEAGIGKSRLIFELRAKAKNFHHYVAQCLPEHANNAMYPILNMLKHRYSLDALEPEEATEILARAIELTTLEDKDTALLILCSWLNLPSPENISLVALSPEQQKQILFKTLIELFIQEPLKDTNHQLSALFIFEDMHWVDPTSIEFIHQFVSTPVLGQFVFVSTSRQSLPTQLSDLNFSTVKLEKLDQADTQEFIGSLFGRPISKSLMDVLITRTDGIPLFIEEMVNMLKQKELVQDINGKIQFVSPEKLNEVPNNLRDSLQQKLDILVNAKETAQLAATIGREFDYNLLVQSSLAGEEQIQADLQELIEAELVFQQRKVTGDTYIFKHALVRDAAYDSMPAMLAREAHAKVATAITIHFPELVKEQPFSVAQHYAGAGEYLDAFKYGNQAIFSLNENSFNTEALLTGDIVSGWLENIEEDEGLQVSLKKECQLKLNSTLIPINTMINGWANSDIEKMATQNGRIINKLDQISNDILTREELEQIKYKSEWSLFIYHHYRGDRAIARELGEKLLKVTQEQKSRVNELLVSTTLGQAYFFDGDYELASKMLARVINNYDKKEDINLSLEFGFDPYYFSCGNLMSIAAITGDLDEAIRYKNLCLSHAIETENLPTIITAYTWGTCYYFLTFDREGMAEWCDKALKAHGDKFESDWILRFFQMNHAWTSYSYDEPAKTVQDAIESGQDGLLSWYDPLLSDTYLNRQMYEEALHIIKASLERSLNSGDKCMLPILYRHLAVTIYHKEGRLTSDCIGNFERAIEEASERGCNWLEMLAVLEWLKLSPDVDQRQQLLTRLKDLTSLIKCSSKQKHIEEAKHLINR